jgi:hypothetical protein
MTLEGAGSIVNESPPLTPTEGVNRAEYSILVSDHSPAPAWVTCIEFQTIWSHGLHDYMDGFLLYKAEALVSVARLPTCLSRKLCCSEIVGRSQALTLAFVYRDYWIPSIVCVPCLLSGIKIPGYPTDGKIWHPVCSLKPHHKGPSKTDSPKALTACQSLKA